MTITEKAAYLRGLVEGQGMDPEAGEGKLWHVLSDLVGDMASQIQDLQDQHEDLEDSLREVEVSLDYLEELFQDDTDDFDADDEDDDDGYYPFGSGRVYDAVAEEDDEDDDEEDEDDDTVYYEVECPNCGESISFDDETLDEGSVICPVCRAVLEFSLPDEDADAEDGEDGENEDGEALEPIDLDRGEE